MNPWQQIKLTLLTLGAVLRGQALAPQAYKPVASAVRSEAEVEALEAASASAAAQPAPRVATSRKQAAAETEREPILAGK
jgi:geranylgeranyl diphosphate/geranylgeranyl-bacteriochlorophyllide a reductase